MKSATAFAAARIILWLRARPARDQEPGGPPRGRGQHPRPAYPARSPRPRRGGRHRPGSRPAGRNRARSASGTRPSRLPCACSMNSMPTSTPRRLTVKSTRSSESGGMAPVRSRSSSGDRRVGDRPVHARSCSPESVCAHQPQPAQRVSLEQALGKSRRSRRPTRSARPRRAGFAGRVLVWRNQPVSMAIAVRARSPPRA